MSKIRITGFTLVALLMFGASAMTTSAFGQTFLLAEVLLNGSTAPAGTPASLTGVVLVEISGLSIDVLCSTIADGTINGAESLFDVEKILNLSDEEIGDGLSGTALLCESDKGCESTMEAEAWTSSRTAGALPWDFEFELEEPGNHYIALLNNAAGYEVKCLIAGLSATDECTAEAGTTTENVNVSDGIETIGAAAPDAECSLGGKTGINEAQPGNLLSSTNGTLSLSSEVTVPEFLLAEVLLNGSAAPADTPASLTGVILEEVSALGIDVLCSAIADGTIDGAESLFDVEKILNLSDEEIGDGLSGTALLCESDKGCESTMEAEAWTNSKTGALPWDFEFELEEPAGRYVALLKSDAGYEVKCLIAGLSDTDECTSETGTTTESANVSDGIEAVGAATPDAECSLGGKTGINEAQPGNLLSSTNGTLSLSSEAG